ncbi:MAG: hypothetical protein WCE51_16025 [Chthoniobacterales bacterium]
MNLKARRLKAARHVSANRRLPFEYRLAWKDDHSIIGPIGDDLIDVLTGRGEIGPLGVSAQQLLPLTRSIEMSLRAAKKDKRDCND